MNLDYPYQDESNEIINYEMLLNSISYKKVKPNKAVRKLIKKSFGNYHNFKKNMCFKESKITYLVLNIDKLEIIYIDISDSPYQLGVIPLLCMNNNYLDHINFSYANKLLERFYG